MSGSVRPSRLISFAAALVLSGAAALAAPQRVVSLNVCTDQMAMLLSGPGQLLAVSKLASDPRTSAMAEQAEGWPVTDGTAEDVFLRAPDLVLAGTYTTRATVEMLERLGVRVERFAPANSLADVRDNLARMGALLGREVAATALIAAFDARLAALTETPDARPRVVMYQALGTTTGADTLAGDVLRAAGFENIAAELGLPFGGRLHLEELLLAQPDLILIGAPYGGHARATELLDHPALAATGALRRIGDGAKWTCETHYILDAVAQMRALRLEWEAAQ